MSKTSERTVKVVVRHVSPRTVPEELICRDLQSRGDLRLLLRRFWLQGHTSTLPARNKYRMSLSFVYL